MEKIRIILGASLLLFLSAQVNAAIVTVGSLTTETDGSSILIFDSLNDREWLRWDLLSGASYQEVLNATSSTGTYSSFNIATSSDATLFTNAAGFPACGDMTTIVGYCGDLLGGFSVFGNSYYDGIDIAWFLSDNGIGDEVGYFFHNNLLEAFGAYADFTDLNSVTNYYEIGWLLYRDSVSVPEPPMVALMLAGLIGLGVARRRDRVQ